MSFAAGIAWLNPLPS